MTLTKGNFGVPATPRDGADIEIIGLLKSSLRWLATLPNFPKLVSKGEIAFASQFLGKSTLTVVQWDKLLQDSFEKQFYIPTDPKQDAEYNVESAYVHR